MKLQIHNRIIAVILEDCAIMAMVESGMGLSILPSLILSRISYQLATLPLDPPAHRDISLIRRFDAASPALAQFQRHLSRFLED